MLRRPRFVLVLALGVALAASAASAKSHLWRFTEVFSNADGSVQFIEMFVFDPAGTQEWQFSGRPLTSDANTFIFPNNLPMENTFQTWVLIATPAFASLPGAPVPDYIIPAGFFDPTGDELRYRNVVDILPLPAGAVPTDGILSYLRDGSTAVNSPTNFAGVMGSVDVSRPCDDTLDNDGDGFVDFPADPGCAGIASPSEKTACQDGIDNDGQIGTDYDGGESILGAGNGDPNGADPQCVGKPWRNKEGTGCGLGFEMAPALVWIGVARRRRRRV